MNRLTDRQLVTRLVSLVGKERSLKVNVVKHLGEIESRSAHLSLGYGSLFEFATKHLGYSPQAETAEPERR